MKRTLSGAAWALGAVLGGACRGTSDPAPTIPEIVRELVASKLTIAALAVAIGPQGRSFFDNFLPCPRRGVIDYHNIPGGRRATFTSCDLGDGVVIEGSADVRWSRTGEDPSTTNAVSIAGDLHVRVELTEPFAADPVDAGGIAFAPGAPTEGIALLDRLTTSSIRVTTRGAIFSLDSRAIPAAVFHPVLTSESLPNPGNALSTLEERDFKRIAFHPMMVLASILFDETLEIQRGQHTHTTPCGTVRVTPDLNRNLPRLEFDWNDCDLGLGAFIGGRFTAEWSDFDARTGHLRMVLIGVINAGGGMPHMQFSEIDWEIGGITTLPTTAPIAGRVVTPNGERRFQFFVEVDD